MSIALISDDDEAAGFLRDALLRRGEHVTWYRGKDDPWTVTSRRPPHVIVVDTAIAEYEMRLRDLAETAPWIRRFLMATPERALRSVVPSVQKPFDASEFAALLSHEVELARLDHRRRTSEAHASDLTVLVESSFEAIIGLATDGEILSWNPGATRLYGYEAAEVVGNSIQVLAAAEDDDEFDGATEKPVEVQRRHKSGSTVRVLLSRSPLPSSGTRFALAEVSLDVTQRRALERELEHSSRLAHIGRISASMSHELNNPIAVIRSSAIWLRDHCTDPQISERDRQEAADDMVVAAERISGFVDQICGFARRGNTAVVHEPIVHALEMSLRMVKPRAKNKRVELHVDSAAAESTFVQHDPTRIAQAVINLLANAIDAAADGGKHVWLTAAPERDYLAIRIRDDGPGVPQQLVDALFEPFYTTKPFGEGTGLGLTLVQQIVQDHKGQLSLHAEDEGGTVAELRLRLGALPPNGAPREEAS